MSVRFATRRSIPDISLQMEKLSEINKQICSIDPVPLNKWRYGELREYLEKQLKESEKQIQEYVKKTSEVRQRLVAANTDPQDISVELYKSRYIEYMHMLERHLELKQKLNAINKTVIGLTEEKIELLETMCGLNTATQQQYSQVMSSQTVANGDFAFPPPSQQQSSSQVMPMYSGIGLRYSQE